jgi:retron-type reverse transcriptase
MAIWFSWNQVAHRNYSFQLDGYFNVISWKIIINPYNVTNLSSTVLLVKLTIAQIVNKVLTFHGTRMIVAM